MTGNKNTAFTKEDKKILFLHGYLSCGKSFYNQLRFFERDFETFAPDLKGFGDNAEMPFAYSLDDYIEEVKEYCYKKGLVNPHVVAHSFGARIAVKAAATKAVAFNRLVLTGAAGLKPKRTLKKTIKRACFSVLKKFVDKNKLTAFYSKDYLSLNAVMKESFIKIVNENLDDLLSSIENKTLLIFGDGDKETPLYMARRYERGIKNSKLIIIKGAGHFAFIDKPNKFNVEVKEFLLS